MTYHLHFLLKTFYLKSFNNTYDNLSYQLHTRRSLVANKHSDYTVNMYVIEMPYASATILLLLHAYQTHSVFAQYKLSSTLSTVKTV